MHSRSYISFCFFISSLYFYIVSCSSYMSSRSFYMSTCLLVHFIRLLVIFMSSCSSYMSSRSFYTPCYFYMSSCSSYMSSRYFYKFTCLLVHFIRLLVIFICYFVFSLFLYGFQFFVYVFSLFLYGCLQSRSLYIYRSFSVFSFLYVHLFFLPNCLATVEPSGSTRKTDPSQKIKMAYQMKAKRLNASNRHTGTGMVL